MHNDEIIYDVSGCVIDIPECQITPAQMNDAMQCLVDNGIEVDDAYEILEALGYILLDAELFPDT